MFEYVYERFEVSVSTGACVNGMIIMTKVFIKDSESRIRVTSGRKLDTNIQLATCKLKHFIQFWSWYYISK